MFEVRKFPATAAACDLVADIERAVWPDTPRNGAEIAAVDRGHGSAGGVDRWLGWYREQVVGHMSVALHTWQRAPGRHEVSVSVHPKFQGEGFGRMLFDHGLQEARRHRDLRELVAVTRQDVPRGVRFLEDRGFTLYKTTCLSELRVAGFELEPRLRSRQQTLDKGVQIVTLGSLTRGPDDWFPQYHHMCNDFLVDLVYPPTPLSLEERRRAHEADSAFDPELAFVALVAGEWAAYTQLSRSLADPGLYWTQLTGTCRRFRRMGLASALKTTAIEAVQARHGHTIRTDNDPRNPMYQINVQFGFRPLPDQLTYHKSWVETA